MKGQENSSFDETFKTIKSLAGSMQDLAQQALFHYTPLVEEIIQSKNRDQQRIQHLLDGILDFCFDNKMLLLFKKICRYYYFINPEEAARYVHFYREMWDENYLPVP